MVKPYSFGNASVTHVCPWDKVQTPENTSQDHSRSSISQHLHLPSCILPRQPLLAPLGAVFILTTFSVLMYQVISLPVLSMCYPLPSPLPLLLLLLILCQKSFHTSFRSQPKWEHLWSSSMSQVISHPGYPVRLVPNTGLRIGLCPLFSVLVRGLLAIICPNSYSGFSSPHSTFLAIGLSILVTSCLQDDCHSSRYHICIPFSKNRE